MALDSEHKLNLAIAAVATTAVTLLAVGAANAKSMPQNASISSAQISIAQSNGPG